MFGTEFAEFLHIVDDVVAVHHACLVAVDDYPFSLVVAAHDSDTVSIGVRSNHEVCSEFCAEVHAHCHGFGILGVGADNGWEVAVDNHLFGHYMNILESPAAQAHGHYLASGAVHGGIDDVEVFLTQYCFLVYHDLLDSHHVVIVHLAAYDFYQVLVALPFDVCYAYFVDLVDNTLVMWLEHLRAVFPIGFVTVIFLGIM